MAIIRPTSAPILTLNLSLLLGFLGLGFIVLELFEQLIELSCGLFVRLLRRLIITWLDNELRLVHHVNSIWLIITFS
jgi:hypothetical protein